MFSRLIGHATSGNAPTGPGAPIFGTTHRKRRLRAVAIGIAGLTILFSAGCEGSGVCGGLQGGSCAGDEYCSFQPGDLCGAADAAATCEARPEVCPAIYAPVCACDGQTYGNSCEAARAGSGVLHEGACTTEGASCELDGVTYPDGTGNIPAGDGCNFCSCEDGRLACTLRACPEPTRCGGRLGDTCTDEQYCAYEGGDCGFADGTSVCLPRPGGCPKIYAPVCGCDGQTYDNSCIAAAAGWGYLSEGPCDGGAQP